MCALTPKAIANPVAVPCRLTITTMTHRLREAEHEYLVQIKLLLYRILSW